YQGMLSELQKTASVQPPPRKPSSPWLARLGGAAAVGGLGYLGYKNWPAIKDTASSLFNTKDAPTSDPTSTPAADQTSTTTPTPDSSSLWDYAWQHPIQAAGVVGSETTKVLVNGHMDAAENATTDPTSAFRVADMD